MRFASFRLGNYFCLMPLVLRRSSLACLSSAKKMNVLTPQVADGGLGGLSKILTLSSSVSFPMCDDVDCLNSAIMSSSVKESVDCWQTSFS